MAIDTGFYQRPAQGARRPPSIPTARGGGRGTMITPMQRVQMWGDMGSAVGSLLKSFGVEWETPGYVREKKALLEYMKSPTHSVAEQAAFAANHPHAYKLYQRVLTDRDKMEEGRARVRVAQLELGEAEWAVEKRKAFQKLFGNVQRDDTGLDIPTLQRMMALDPAKTFDFLRGYQQIRQIPFQQLKIAGGAFAQQYNILSSLAQVPEGRRREIYDQQMKEWNKLAGDHPQLKHASETIHGILFDETSGTLDLSDKNLSQAINAAATATDAAGMAAKRIEALEVQSKIAKNRASVTESMAKARSAEAKGFKDALNAIEDSNLPDERKSYLTERLIDRFMPAQGGQEEGATLSGATAEAVDAVNRARGGGPAGAETTEPPADGTAAPGETAAPPETTAPGPAAGGSPTFNLEGVDKAVSDAYGTLRRWLGGEGGETAATPPEGGGPGPMGRGRPDAPGGGTAPPATREPGPGTLRDRAAQEVQGVLDEADRRRQQDQAGPMGRRPAGAEPTEDQARAQAVMSSGKAPSEWTLEEVETVLKHGGDIPRRLRRSLTRRRKALLKEKSSRDNNAAADAPVTIPETGAEKKVADMTLDELSAVIMQGGDGLSRAQLRAIDRRLKEMRAQ